MHWRRPVPCPASRPTARQATDTPTDAGWLSHSPLTQKRQKQHEPRATPPMCWIKNGSPEKNAHPDQTELKDLSTNQTQHREDPSTNNTPVGQPPIGRPMPPIRPWRTPPWPCPGSGSSYATRPLAARRSRRTQPPPQTPTEHMAFSLSPNLFTMAARSAAGTYHPFPLPCVAPAKAAR